nr:MAG TPA: nucleic-acid-binding protein [Caudoviricetes sp.]
MSLFQCEHCGCVENTALSSQGFNGFFERLYNWSYAPERKGKRLCSACGPVKYRDGNPTPYGKWHNVFARQYLPLGKFKTNSQGNLQHIETGDIDYQNYLVPPSEVSKQ